MKAIRPNFLLGVGCGILLALVVLAAELPRERTEPPSREQLVAAARQLGMVFPEEVETAQPSAPAPPVADQAKTVIIPAGATANEIAALLQNAGLIENDDSFLARIRERQAVSRLKPGQYRFTEKPNLDQIIDQLIAGP